MIPFQPRPDLHELVPPPEAPFRAPVDWAAFADANGFAPPRDYRALMDAYGAGTFEAGVGRLELQQAVHPAASFLDRTKWIRDNLRGLQRQFQEQEPAWPIYPDPGGFLPFAVDDTSWTIGWLTAGPPESWIVAIDGGRDGWWAEVPCGAREFVTRWASGDLRIREVQRVTEESGFFPGRFLPRTEDEFVSERTQEANVIFGARASSADFSQWPSAVIAARVAPGHLLAHGSGNRMEADGNYGPIRATLSVAYRPEDERQVVAAIQAIAAELGTEIFEATALDGSPIWQDVTSRTESAGPP